MTDISYWITSVRKKLENLGSLFNHIEVANGTKGFLSNSSLTGSCNSRPSCPLSPFSASKRCQTNCSSALLFCSHSLSSPGAVCPPLPRFLWQLLTELLVPGLFFCLSFGSLQYHCFSYLHSSDHITSFLKMLQRFLMACTTQPNLLHLVFKVLHGRVPTHRLHIYKRTSLPMHEYKHNKVIKNMMHLWQLRERIKYSSLQQSLSNERHWNEHCCCAVKQ